MTDFGWSYPPGVSSVPGDEDDGWDHYWDKEQDRILEVFKKVYGREPTKDETKESDGFYGFYDKDKEFAKAIDEDFELWKDTPPDDERI